MATLRENLSAFPNGIDEFNEVFDLPHGKYDNAARLSQLKAQPTLNNAEQDELIRLTNELHPYMITPQTWNKFGSALYSVQKFFKENVQDFIMEKQRLWQSYINDFRHVGSWTAGKTYKFQNLVSDSTGDLYICKANHVSVAGKNPSKNTSQWIKLSSKGDKGDIGLNATFRGVWSNTTSYNTGDAVSFPIDSIEGGVVYIAKRPSVGKSPAASVDDWMLYQQLIHGRVAPVGTGVGTHFIEVID